MDPPGDHTGHRQHRPHDPPAGQCRDTLARLQKTHSRLELNYGRPATLAELAGEVEMPEGKVTEALRFAAEPLSLSDPLREDGDAELGDVVADRSAETPFEVVAPALLPRRSLACSHRSTSASGRS